jgi:hypothetical protein
VKISISQAAKTWGKSRQTIYNHLKSGELSSSQDSNGNTQIDTSELIRVFGEAPTKPTKAKQKQAANNSEVLELRHQLEIERIRREHAESRAELLLEQKTSLEGQIERIQGQQQKALETFGESIKLLKAPETKQPTKSFINKILGI